MREGYFKKIRGTLTAEAVFLVLFGIYFSVLCNPPIPVQDVIYFGLLYVTGAVYFILRGYKRYREEREETDTFREKLAAQSETAERLREEIREQNDYIAKWVHEVKVPLAALELMNVRNEDEELKRDMKEGTERIGRLLKNMLMYSKMEGMENDVQYKETELKEAVNEAVKNQAYFLIKENIQVELKLGKCTVYTDKRWLVYILDQMIANAVKYAACKEEGSAGKEANKGNFEPVFPRLTFIGNVISGDVAELCVEDNGRGIKAGDLPYIFDRGYTGGNVRNGDYRSTGMGLYFAKNAADRLGIGLRAESEEGKWTRFVLRFENNRSVDNRTKDDEASGYFKQKC